MAQPLRPWRYKTAYGTRESYVNGSHIFHADLRLIIASYRLGKYLRDGKRIPEVIAVEVTPRTHVPGLAEALREHGTRCPSPLREQHRPRPSPSPGRDSREFARAPRLGAPLRDRPREPSSSRSRVVFKESHHRRQRRERSAERRHTPSPRSEQMESGEHRARSRYFR